MLNHYFNRKEFTCGCGCGFNTVDVQLLDILTAVRTHFNQPVIITSGCRCPSYNKAVGGAPNSFHLDGRAADIKVKETSPKEVYAFLEETYPHQYGFMEYRRWVHVDSREYPFRRPL